MQILEDIKVIISFHNLIYFLLHYCHCSKSINWCPRYEISHLDTIVYTKDCLLRFWWMVSYYWVMSMIFRNGEPLARPAWQGNFSWSCLSDHAGQEKGHRYLFVLEKSLTISCLHWLDTVDSSVLQYFVRKLGRVFVPN